MGVTGLLQHLKQIQEPASLTKYKGQTLAVDTYGWLHRGLISCAEDLCTDTPTRGYITSVLKKVEMLRHFGVNPLMVFDGSPLPTKEATHIERRLKRDKAREQALEYVQKGNKKAAWKEYMKAAAVTPEMAKSVMVELERMGVSYVVAPYEADPQMVYLEKTGVVDGILSEDSDLLVFGCRRLITKLNDYGECIEICTDNLAKVPRMQLHTFTPSQWRLVAILSGCDYTKGIPGVGLKTAFNMVSKLSNLEKIVASFRADNKTVPEEFLDEALKADLAFQFQKVFDLKLGEVTTLCKIPQVETPDMSVVELCCGRSLEPEVHAGICKGELHPSTHKPLISREQNLSVIRSHSVTFKSTASVGKKSMSAPSLPPKSQSFSNSKSIDSYFKSGKVETTQKTAISKIQAAPVLKRPSEKTTQLSPSSRKLRRFATPAQSVSLSTPGGAATQSKFFAASTATAPKIASVPLSLHCPTAQADADFGFCTGDSEVPENSSSPVRQESHLAATGCVTDVDEDNTDPDFETSVANSMANSATQISTSTRLGSDFEDDEGYENELDESPIKKTSVSLLWRKKFAMGSSNTESEAAETSIRKHEAVKVSLPPAELEETSFDESPESSSGPHTPEPVAEKPLIAGDSSQLKSSQQTFISEIEEDFDFSPERQAQPLPPKHSFSKLSRFAFTG